MTIILFAELAKRSYSELKQQEIFLLYYMAGAALATPFQGLLWSQYLVQSDAARMLGLIEFIPAWVAPGPDSPLIGGADFFPQGLAYPHPFADWNPDYSTHRPVWVGLCTYTALPPTWKSCPFRWRPWRPWEPWRWLNQPKIKKKLEMAHFFHRRGYRACLWRDLCIVAHGFRLIPYGADSTHSHSLG